MPYKDKKDLYSAQIATEEKFILNLIILAEQAPVA